VTFKQNLKWVIGNQWDRYMDRGFKMDIHGAEILQMFIDRWLQLEGLNQDQLQVFKDGFINGAVMFGRAGITRKTLEEISE